MILRDSLIKTHSNQTKSWQSSSHSLRITADILTKNKGNKRDFDSQVIAPKDSVGVSYFKLHFLFL